MLHLNFCLTFLRFLSDVMKLFFLLVRCVKNPLITKKVNKKRRLNSKWTKPDDERCPLLVAAVVVSHNKHIFNNLNSSLTTSSIRMKKSYALWILFTLIWACSDFYVISFMLKLKEWFVYLSCAQTFTEKSLRQDIIYHLRRFFTSSLTKETKSLPPTPVYICLPKLEKKKRAW